MGGINLGFSQQFIIGGLLKFALGTSWMQVTFVTFLLPESVKEDYAKSSAQKQKPIQTFLHTLHITYKYVIAIIVWSY
jgi:hypothetical protein